VLRRVAAGFVGLTVLTAGVVVAAGRLRHKTLPSRCVIGAYELGLPEASNASTIAAVGKTMGLPDHAVTIALAAALQESKLQNLDHGDLDSVGLFQQRPSQGWGPSDQLLVPRLAAAAFYRALTRVRGWQGMAVTDAAQAVQHSAAPDAYAQWEGEARSLAIALTGEAPSAVACQFPLPRTPTADLPLAEAVQAGLGSAAIGAPVTPTRGWIVAAWLVTHAFGYRIRSVSFLGQVWTSSSAWHPGGTGASQVDVQVA